MLFLIDCLAIVRGPVPPKILLLSDSFLSKGSVPPGELKNIISQIHTKVVEEAISGLEVNKVLQARPPAINNLERSLPRPTRAVLSQLRSGYCSRLNNYRFKIGASASATFPNCNAAPDSASHLFECPAHPTTLSTVDLWERPWDVAAHLTGVPAFADLPDPGPPPPPPQTRRNVRPPPEPPPLASDDSYSFSSLSLNSSREE